MFFSQNNPNHSIFIPRSSKGSIGVVGVGIGGQEEQGRSASLCVQYLAVAWVGSAGHLFTFRPEDRVVRPLIDVTRRLFQVCFDLWQTLSSFANTAYFFQRRTRLGWCLLKSRTPCCAPCLLLPRGVGGADIHARFEHRTAWFCPSVASAGHFPRCILMCDRLIPALQTSRYEAEILVCFGVIDDRHSSKGDRSARREALEDVKYVHQVYHRCDVIGGLLCCHAPFPT